MPKNRTYILIECLCYLITLKEHQTDLTFDRDPHGHRPPTTDGAPWTKTLEIETLPPDKDLPMNRDLQTETPWTETPRLTSSGSH